MAKITYLILTLLSVIGILFFLSNMLSAKEPKVMTEAGLNSEYIHKQPTVISSLLTSKPSKNILEITRSGMAFIIGLE